jgi:carbamoyltransferase
MNLIGFYLGMHDSSVCASIDGVIRYRKFERNSGIKHQRAALKDVIKAVESWGVQPQYVAYTDGNRNGLGCCGIDQLFAEAGNVLGASSVQKTFCLDHHFAHALSTWPLGPVPDRALAIAMDGRATTVCVFERFSLGLGQMLNNSTGQANSSSGASLVGSVQACD